MLFSCSSNDDNSDTQNDSFINPPAWIQGTWLAETISGSDLGFEFTTDDFCFINGTTTMCNKSQIDQYNSIGQNVVVNEIITDTEYTVEIDYNNQQGITTYQFEKISNTQIEWINDTLGDLVETVFTKQ